MTRYVLELFAHAVDDGGAESGPGGEFVCVVGVCLIEMKRGHIKFYWWQYDKQAMLPD